MPFKDDARKADDGVERCAQFMAHVGKELALHAVQPRAFPSPPAERVRTSGHYQSRRQSGLPAFADMRNLIFLKGIGGFRLNVDRADDARTDPQGDGGFRARIGEHGVELCRGFSATSFTTPRHRLPMSPCPQWICRPAVASAPSVLHLRARLRLSLPSGQH
jgi:hypothetical protein